MLLISIFSERTLAQFTLDIPGIVLLNDGPSNNISVNFPKIFKTAFSNNIRAQLLLNNGKCNDKSVVLTTGNKQSQLV